MRWNPFRRAAPPADRPPPERHRDEIENRIRGFRSRRSLAIAYDCVDWHTAVEFPEELPPTAAATHIGLFLEWVVRRGLIADHHREHSAQAIDDLVLRRWTGSRFLLEACEGILWHEDLSELGNRFARAYYLSDVGYGPYLDDYVELLVGHRPSVYHVPDEPASFQRLAPRIERRFEDWSLAESEIRRAAERARERRHSTSHRG